MKSKWATAQVTGVCQFCGRPLSFVPLAPLVRPGDLVHFDQMGLVYSGPETCPGQYESLEVTRSIEATGRATYAHGFCFGPVKVTKVIDRKRVGKAVRDRVSELVSEGERVDLAAECHAPLAPDRP